ncbi:MAG: triose-phosphate isomerase [Bacteroidales bacterium]|nr:triose-phosphate isomerase [Bacteroidales bacterium]
MRKNIVAGNWKMNKTLQEGIELAQAVDKGVASLNASGVEVILGTPFIHLTEVCKTVKNVSVSAQNCASEAKGAYTGEVSAEMIKSTGTKYVIIGHSERRTYYKEDNQILNKKVKLTLANGLQPIFCCGELLSERESNNHFKVVETQLAEGIFDLPKEDFLKIVIAYEPVWAIGTGVVATSGQAQEMHKFIRDLIFKKYGADVATETSLLYGGSCNPSNAKELFANPDVDGGLIGGASLKSEDFLALVKSF